MGRVQVVIALIAVLCLLSALVDAQPAGYRYYYLQEVATMGHARISAGEATVVTWEVGGTMIWTGAVISGHQYPVDYHGNGREPVVMRTGVDFLLAFVWNDHVRLRCGDGLDWADCGELTGGSGSNPKHPDLGVWGPQAQPYIVWQEGARIYLSLRDGGAWTAPMEVASDAWYDAWPQVEPSWYLGQPRPRVYYLTETYGQCVYRQFDGQAWGSPVQVSVICGGPIDVATIPDAGLKHGILYLGLQAPCYCNRIFFQAELEDGSFGPIEELTVVQDEYNWPIYCGLAAEQDRFHAFWYQEFYDEGMTLTGQQIYRSNRVGGLWSPPNTDFDGHVGRSTDIGCPLMQGPVPPSYCWVETVGNRVRVVLMAPDAASAVEELRLVPAGVQITPNPFVTSTQIRLDARPDAPVRLEVFDLAGRRVVDADLRVSPAGQASYEWDGRDRQGATLPAGVYPLRLHQSGAVWTGKIVRLP